MVGMNVVGVQFRKAGKIYDFAADHHEIHIGDEVVVDTERGQSIARVVQLKYQPADPGLKPIIRRASEKDLRVPTKITPGFAEDYAKSKVKEFGLNMKILSSEIQFGGNKVIVYFSAEGRVDFRDLVKTLATGLKARVELKQVGSRDETKILGGLGVCGREYCCSSFLREFVPVSIKMAKNQNLALNPTKVSGGCGRLLCCLTYENDLYSDLRKLLPPRGTKVRLKDGAAGVVIRGDLLNQTVEIDFGNGQFAVEKVSHCEIVDKTSTQKEDDLPEWGEDIDLKQLMD